MSPSWALTHLAYHSIDLLAFFYHNNFYTVWPILLKLGGQFPNFQESKMTAGCWPSCIYEIAITFKPLDRSFRNLLTNSNPRRLLPATFTFSKNLRWQPRADGHLVFLKSRWLSNRLTDLFKMLRKTSDPHGLVLTTFIFSKIQDDAPRPAAVLDFSNQSQSLLYCLTNRFEIWLALITIKGYDSRFSDLVQI
jgi:hypothetical protein